jgi:excisionase family DNA binding protein
MDTQRTAVEISAIGPFYTTSEVSRMLHMSQRVVQEWVRTGQLRAAHYGTAWRISHADLEAFVAQASADSSRPTPPADAGEE